MKADRPIIYITEGFFTLGGYGPAGECWTEFFVDPFAGEEPGECAGCGDTIGQGWLLLDGGEEYCRSCVDVLDERDEDEEVLRKRERGIPVYLSELARRCTLTYLGAAQDEPPSPDWEPYGRYRFRLGYKDRCLDFDFFTGKEGVGGRRADEFTVEEILESFQAEVEMADYSVDDLVKELGYTCSEAAVLSQALERQQAMLEFLFGDDFEVFMEARS